MSTPQKESEVGQVTNIAPVSLKNVGRRSTLTLSRQNIVVQGKFLIGGYVKRHYLSWSGWQQKINIKCDGYISGGGLKMQLKN